MLNEDIGGNVRCPFYPAVCSMGGILSLVYIFHSFIHSFILYSYKFLCRGFTDPREILHGSSATSQTGLLLFWGDSPRNGWIICVNRDYMSGYASCWSTCLWIWCMCYCVGFIIALLTVSQQFMLCIMYFHNTWCPLCIWRVVCLCICR